MAEYEKRVRKKLTENGCYFYGMAREIMIFGSALLPNCLLP